MSLTSRISFKQADSSLSPEDILSHSLGVIFTDDVTCQHSSEGNLLYTSPHLPHDLEFSFTEPEKWEERKLFSHYLWNASLLLAELMEVPRDRTGAVGEVQSVRWDVQGKAVAEVGAGTGLPSIMAGLLGAQSLLVTDYPSPGVMQTLRENVTRNLKQQNAPPPKKDEGPAMTVTSNVQVLGHEWGRFDGLGEHRGVYDRVLVCDCLWMPWQHVPLMQSIAYLMAADGEAWVVGGFHTGRARMKGFFDAETLNAEGLVVHSIWERDCDGVERSWDPEREEEEQHVRKRWLVVAVVKKIQH
jgi:predicted nicotinamide N-methyase